MSIHSRILSIATYLPEAQLTNSDLSKVFPDWSSDKILAKTGIAIRHIAAETECASDLGIKAAKKLFSSGKHSPKDIDFLLFCTQSPDHFLPTSACRIQNILGLPTTCGALDFNLGCSGFVYGLSLAQGLIASGSASKVLLITAETYSKYIHPKDKSVRTLFGDGASATIIGASEESGIGQFVFGTDGSGYSNLIVPSGGHRLLKNEETATEIQDSSGNIRSADNLYMNGGEIFNFTIETVPNSLASVLEKNNLTMDTVDYFVFHQANQYMLEHLRKKCKIPQEKFCLNMKTYGNTVSATIPMALELSFIQNAIGPSDTVALIGFGVGYSWAATIIKIGEELIP